MAVMIPSVIAPEVRSSAERRIFEWFRSAPGTDDWIVLHSLGLSTHKRVIYGETDFFVLAPNMGAFALEVKGGRVRRSNGTWYFTDKYGNTNSKVRGPFDQAKEGIFSIVASLSERLDLSHQHLKHIFYGYGVMFPDIDYDADGIDEQQWQVFDSRDGKNVKAYMLRLIQGARNHWEAKYGPLKGEKLPTLEDIQYLADLLRGDFDCVPAIKAQFRNADEALIRLTKEQYRCLDQLDDNPRCLIYGPAGTGKTLLAIEEVKKATAQGEKVALFCFNNNLADWLENYFSTVAESLRPAYVGTLHKYMVQVAKEAGKLPSFPRNSEDLPAYYQHLLPGAAAESLRGAEAPFDKIVLDEAQDMIKDSYLAFLQRCVHKGLIRGRWTMFGDFSMQAIYADGVAGTELLEKLDELTSFIRFKLNINCRNAKPICLEIEKITEFKAPSASWATIEGPPVQYITWSNDDEQRQKLESLLKSLLDSHIDPEQITILSPRKWEDSVASQVHGYDIRKYRIPLGMHISFCTIQGYKGLENTVIILTDVESFSSEKLMYVGLSRATSGLYVLESNAAKQEYDGLLIRRLLQ